MPEEEVRAFEVEHGIRLPSEYRTFLVQAGRGGVGPGYGLFNFHEMDHYHDHCKWTAGGDFVGILANPFPYTEEWNDITGIPDDELIEEDEYRYEELLHKWEEWYYSPLDGAIPICHHGCNIRDWLVLTGPEAGNIWTDFRADYQGLVPVTKINKPRLTFFSWYRDWIDKAIAIAKLNFSWGTIKRCPNCGAGNPEEADVCIRCSVNLIEGVADK